MSFKLLFLEPVLCSKSCCVSLLPDASIQSTNSKVQVNGVFHRIITIGSYNVDKKLSPEEPCNTC